MISPMSKTLKMGSKFFFNELILTPTIAPKNCPTERVNAKGQSILPPQANNNIEGTLKSMIMNTLRGLVSCIDLPKTVLKTVSSNTPVAT